LVFIGKQSAVADSAILVCDICDIMEAMAKFEIKWDAPEYEHREKGVSWYWISIIIAAAIIVFAVWNKNYLFGLFIVIAEMLLIIWGSRPPRVLNFVLTDEELSIHEQKVHSLKEFESWSVNKNDATWADLHFYFHARLKMPLRVIVPIARIDEVRADLQPLLREIEHEVSLLDSIEKFLGF